MAALNVTLLEHISRDNIVVYSIGLGDAELPICHSVGKEVKSCTTKSDPVGASAILYAYSNAILLEALEPRISILPPNWTSSSSNANKHEGVRVRPSTPQAQVLVQLRPGDQFIINSRRFSLTISEPDPVQFTPSVSEHSTVVDLEEADVDNTDTDLPLQGDGNAGSASASASHPSLPGDEIDMFESANIGVSHGADVEEPFSKSRMANANADLVGGPTAKEHVQYSMESLDTVDQVDQNPATIVSREPGPEQDLTLVELETAKLAQQKVVSPGICISLEGISSDVEALPIETISPRLAQRKGEMPPAPSEVTSSRTSLVPTIPEDDKQSGNNAGTSSVLTRAEAKSTPETQKDQQTLNEQPPKTAQFPSDVQPTEYHKTHPVDRSNPPSSARSSRASSRQISDANLVADSGVQSTSREDSAQAPYVLPQAQDVDTQTSTIARIDELFHLAGVDSDLNNNVTHSEGEPTNSSPGKVTLATDVEAETKEKDWIEPRTNLAPVGDESTESSTELDSPTPGPLPARGRPRGAQPSNLKRSLKRKLESPVKNASLQLKTPAKRRKIKDTESSMESTIEVRPRSSRRKVTSSQTPKTELRGASVLSSEPNFSSPSQRTTQSQGISAESYDGPPPRIIFSSNSTVDEKAHLMAFLTSQGGRQVKAVKDCTVLCVGPGELKRTGKLLLAVVSGKDIVRDKWLVDSARQRRLLDPSQYSAEDSDREVEWGTKLADAIARGKAGTKPFTDSTIYFTPALKKELGSGFMELKEVALLAGAAAVHARLPPKGADPQANILVLASSHDRDGPTLAEAGWTCYNKDVISMSVLQGRLNTESFRLDLQQSAAELNSGRKRKKR